MFSKQEAAWLKKDFWTTFGQYMRPVVAADGEQVNWINYKTGVKNLFFKLNADNGVAAAAIELHHPDPSVRDLYFEQFYQLRKFLEPVNNNEWIWQPIAIDEFDKQIARIYITKSSVSVFKRDDWPELISFLKQSIVTLDKFWSSAKYSFEALH